MLKNKKSNIPLAIYKNIIRMMSKANQASDKVLEENRRLRISTPFSLQGRIYHLMPDGRIVSKNSNRAKHGLGSAR